MKAFTTPGIKETREILIKLKVRKAAPYRARAALEAIKSKLDGLKCKKEFYQSNESKLL